MHDKKDFYILENYFLDNNWLLESHYHLNLMEKNLFLKKMVIDYLFFYFLEKYLLLDLYNMMNNCTFDIKVFLF